MSRQTADSKNESSTDHDLSAWQRRPNTVTAGALILGTALLVGGSVASLDLNHDIAISMTSALRLVSGQKLYVDFSEPHGPLSGWLLAVVMLAIPIPGWALVVASAVLNAAASVLMWATVLQVTRDNETAIQAGVLTSFWFLPVFGAYYHDHLAYFLVLAGFSSHVLRPPGVARAATTAVLFVLAFHTKQTVAVPGMLALAVSCLAAEGKRALYDRHQYGTAALMLLTLAMSFALIFSVGEYDKYWFHTVQTPAEFARTDNAKSPLGLLYTLLYPFRTQLNFFHLPNPRTLFFAPVCLLVYWSYFRLHRWHVLGHSDIRQGDHRTIIATLVFLLLSSLWCSALLGRWAQEVTFGVWGAFAIGWSTYRMASLRRSLAVIGCVLALPQIYSNHPLMYEPDASLTRTELRPLRVRYSPNQYDLDATAAVVEYLRDRPGRLAILDEAAVLIPLALGRASWGPSSYLCDGLCVPLDPVRRVAWQREFIDLLVRRDVDYIVRVTGFAYGEARGRVRGRDVYGLDLPVLGTFVEEFYTPVFEHAGYEVLQSRLAEHVRETRMGAESNAVPWK